MAADHTEAQRAVDALFELERGGAFLVGRRVTDPLALASLSASRGEPPADGVHERHDGVADAPMQPSAATSERL